MADCLDPGFMATILDAARVSKSPRVVKTEMETVTSAGDNYASRMYRCRIYYLNEEGEGDRVKEHSVIVKAMPTGEMSRLMTRANGFVKEREALSALLPRLNEILGAAYPSAEALAPVCYHQSARPEEILIMEDLRRTGYVLANRLQGLDDTQLELVLTALARLHAASSVLIQTDPGSVNTFRVPFWTRETLETLQSFSRYPFLILSEKALEWDNTDRGRRRSEKLAELGRTVSEWVPGMFRGGRGPEVLAHGDPWVNNFMFRCEPTGKVVAVKLLDYQLAHVGFPATDLHYLLFTSTRAESRFERIDHLLRLYHGAFEESAKRLNSARVPDFADFRAGFEEKYPWGLFATCAVYPHFLLPPEEALASQEFINGPMERFRRIFDKPEMRTFFTRAFDFFQEKGVL